MSDEIHIPRFICISITSNEGLDIPLTKLLGFLERKLEGWTIINHFSADVDGAPRNDLAFWVADGLLKLDDVGIYVFIVHGFGFDDANCPIFLL